MAASRRGNHAPVSVELSRNCRRNETEDYESGTESEVANAIGNHGRSSSEGQSCTREAPARGVQPGLPVPLGGTYDGEGKPITPIALLPLCRPSNTPPFCVAGHFVAPVRPCFTISLGGEIRATKTGER